MYTIHINDQRNKVDVIFSGKITIDELQAYINDVYRIITEFDLSQILLLIDIVKLDPFPQEYLDLFISGLAEPTHLIKKLAIVYKKVVTRMQFERIISSINCYTKRKITYQVFISRMDALSYLYE